MFGSFASPRFTRTTHSSAPSRSCAARLGLAIAVAGALACAHEGPTHFATETTARPLSEPAAGAPGRFHRWETVTGGAISVWVDSGPGLVGWSPEIVALAYDAARAWETPGVPLRFVRAIDEGSARVRLHWRWTTPWELGGATRLEMNPAGETALADCWVVLSRTRDGKRLSADALRVVLLHEFGHALGLPHSRSRWAIMYDGPGAADTITPRDRAALAALYGVTLGARVGAVSDDP